MGSGVSVPEATLDAKAAELGLEADPPGVKAVRALGLKKSGQTRGTARGVGWSSTFNLQRSTSAESSKSVCSS